MLRRGGAGELDAAAFDERADFLAANISSFGGDTSSAASMNCITPVLSECLGLFFDMLQKPRFDEERLKIEKNTRLENYKQRNDDAGDILSREWQWLLRGREHFTSRYGTQTTLDAISREDLIAFHEKYWVPANMQIAISGDVDTKAILAELEKRFATYESVGKATDWPPPAPDFTPTPGLYHVEKDIPQAKVYIGHLSTQWQDWSDEDMYALMVAGHIFGESGFTSRITKRIRSDEGLAYSAGAAIQRGTYWPGYFRVSFQTKSRTVALAAQIALEETRRLQSEKVSQDELDTARNALIESFPQSFNSAGSIVGTFIGDEWIDRPQEFWDKWRERVAAVDAGDVQRVAKKYLRPDEVIFLVVGKWEDILPGDENGRASMAEFGADKAVELPLRDPVTLEASSE
jgi:predicted Zn-dependent peptidase